MAEVEKIATNRYKVTTAHSQVMNVSEVMSVSAQDLRDIYNWCLLHLRELEQEVKEAQAYQDTHEYMEHHYLGGK